LYVAVRACSRPASWSAAHRHHRDAGLRWLTDPTLSPPGEYEGGLVKTTGPAIGADELGAIDAADLPRPPRRQPRPAARVHAGQRGAGVHDNGQRSASARRSRLGEWATATVGDVTVTAVPALHGPPGCEEITGPVIGFVLSAERQPTVYVAGDNASLQVVAEIADRCGPIEIARVTAYRSSKLPFRLGTTIIVVPVAQ
jgi:L-ascorbate metabolism protein UlaG (beta-lactamase superfamily)